MSRSLDGFVSPATLDSPRTSPGSLDSPRTRPFEEAWSAPPLFQSGSSPSPSDKKPQRSTTLRHIEEELEALDLETPTDFRPHRCFGLLSACRAPEQGSERCMDAPCAHAFFGGVLMLNAIFIGLETDHRGSSDEHWSKWFLAESLFLCIFIAEVVLRCWSLGCREAARDNWNLFDIVIVTLGALDSWVLQFAFPHVTGWLRPVRLLRVLRIIRLFRIFRELQLLAQSILGALRAMVWAALLIVLGLYLAAVLATNLFGRHNGGVRREGELDEWFGSIGSSVFTLFQLMTLEDWPDIVRRVMQDEPLAWMFFIPFMMFMNFAMLNVITAVVVEKVFTIAHSEIAEVSKREEQKHTGTLRKIRHLFNLVDQDSNKELELEEFRDALRSATVVQQFMELGIAKYDADDLFACLDLDGDYKLSVAEFVEGCLRVHGPGQSKHLLQIQYDILRNWESLRLDLEDLGSFIRWVIRHLSYRSSDSFAPVRPPQGGQYSRAADIAGDRPVILNPSVASDVAMPPLFAGLSPHSPAGSSTPEPTGGSIAELQPDSPTSRISGGSPTWVSTLSPTEPGGGKDSGAPLAREDCLTGDCPGGGGTAVPGELPGMDGQAAVEELREIRRTQKKLRAAVEGLIEEVRCIREELPKQPAEHEEDEQEDDEEEQDGEHGERDPEQEEEEEV